jgi:hypothetical protein
VAQKQSRHLSRDKTVDEVPRQRQVLPVGLAESSRADRTVESSGSGLGKLEGSEEARTPDVMEFLNLLLKAVVERMIFTYIILACTNSCYTLPRSRACLLNELAMRRRQGFHGN